MKQKQNKSKKQQTNKQKQKIKQNKTKKKQEKKRNTSFNLAFTETHHLFCRKQLQNNVMIKVSQFWNSEFQNYFQNK